MDTHDVEFWFGGGGVAVFAGWQIVLPANTVDAISSVHQQKLDCLSSKLS